MSMHFAMASYDNLIIQSCKTIT